MSSVLDPRPLGATPLVVSPVTLGASSLGDHVDRLYRAACDGFPVLPAFILTEEEAAAILIAAVDP